MSQWLLQNLLAAIKKGDALLSHLDTIYLKRRLYFVFCSLLLAWRLRAIRQHCINVEGTAAGSLV